MKTITVEDVHREFFTASEEMVEVFSKIDKERFLKKVERLDGLGFQNCSDMNKVSEYHNFEETKRIIDQYALSHPNNKVISKSDVIRICQKYGLLLRPSVIQDSFRKRTCLRLRSSITNHKMNGLLGGIVGEVVWRLSHIIPK
jgi:hypothetical protein